MSEIINEELIDHRNRTSLGLPPPRKLRRGPHIKLEELVMDSNWTNNRPYIRLGFGHYHVERDTIISL